MRKASPPSPSRPGPGRGRRRRALDRDHVVRGGTAAAVEGRRQGRPADRDHHELRHQRPHHDGHHARGRRRADPASLGTQPVAIGANCGVGASELLATVLGISDAAARCSHRRQGQLRHPAIRRRPHPLQRHAGADGRLRPPRARCRRADHRRLLRHQSRSIWPPCGNPSRATPRVRGPRSSSIEQRLGPVSDLAKGIDTAAEGAAKRERRRGNLIAGVLPLPF